jgi:hypothetical protein
MYFLGVKHVYKELTKENGINLIYIPGLDPWSIPGYSQ